MDQQSSARWLETLRREQKAKEKWQGKYLTDEMREKQAEEEAEALRILAQSQAKPSRRISERDAMELRLASFENEVQPPAAEPVLPEYEVLRRRVAEQVAQTRQRSHRFTGDLSTGSMLKDIGPQLWTSINPGARPDESGSWRSGALLGQCCRTRGRAGALCECERCRLRAHTAACSM